MTSPVPQLLERLRSGDQSVLNDLVTALYDELRRIAARHLRGERPEHTLQTTALVHEAYLRLFADEPRQFAGRVHFLAVASRVMRQVLVDLARARTTEKRDIMKEVKVADIPDFGSSSDETLLLMDAALDRLGRTDPLKVQLIEMRYFGGMTAEESAATLSMSVHTVRRELRLAQAWLHKEMSG